MTLPIFKNAVISIGGITTCLFSGTSAMAQSWVAFDLGTPEIAVMNNLGQVAASFTTSSGNVAFLTGPNAQGVIASVNLGPSVGSSYSRVDGVNDAGQVIGTHEGHAFITGPNGQGMADLGLPSSTYDPSSATAEPYSINNLGQVVGSAYSAQVGTFFPFITGANGQGIAPVNNVQGVAAINDLGQLVGQVGSHAFVTGPNGQGQTVLGDFGGAFSSALAINNSGVVVGRAQTTSLTDHAFIYGVNGQGMRDLGTLNGSYDYSTAFSLNDAGNVVGLSYSASGYQHAFITGANGQGMLDLSSMTTLPDGSYLDLRYASQINDRDQILALGSDGHTYLLNMTSVPEPASVTMMALGLAAIVMTAGSRRSRAVASVLGPMRT